MRGDLIYLEDSARRSLQFGVAKKIKNGARKIVLDKAEEARIAAFSAFKSLGYDVPQFTAPLLPAAACDSIRKESGNTSGSNTADTSHSFVDADHINNSKEVDLVKAREDLIKSSDDAPLAPVDGKSSSEIQCRISTETSTVPVAGPMRKELNATFDRTKSSDVTTVSVQLQKINDKTIIHDDGCHAPGIEEQHQSGNLASCNGGSSSERGPINAVSRSGGLDSFLDLWDTIPEFYFDIHYIKRLELHAVAPFELHGIAICWENSPVYYINLPRDILLSDNRSDDCLSLSALCYKQKVSSSNSKHDFEIARHRWSRISKIFGKENVRKFTWNLKIQIQVLKKPAVSVQRFGCLDTLGNSVDLEIVDNSYILLSPIYVRDAIDMCIVAWILWPDEERSSNPNLDKVI